MLPVVKLPLITRQSLARSFAAAPTHVPQVCAAAETHAVRKMPSRNGARQQPRDRAFSQDVAALAEAKDQLAVAAEAVEMHAKLQRARQEAPHRALVIPATSARKTLFDIFVSLCTLYVSVTAPVKMAYCIDFGDELDCILDALFILDVLLHFFHGFIELGYPVLDLRRIAHTYARGWFAFDLLTSLPLRYAHPTLRLIKTLRILGTSRLLNRWLADVGATGFRVLLILGIWLLTAHWWACGFFALGWMSKCAGGDGATWLTSYWPELQPDCHECAARVPSTRHALLQIPVTKDVPLMLSPPAFVPRRLPALCVSLRMQAPDTFP